MPDVDEKARVAFRARVERQRKYGRPIVFIFGALWLTVLAEAVPSWAAWRIPRAVFLTLAVLVVLEAVTLVTLIAITGPLRCGRCSCRLDSSRLDRYCPECGGPPGLRPASGCMSCGQILVRHFRSGRTWKIRFCTFCGVKLDDVGV